MTTVPGWRMLVAMTNCGDAGWLSDRSGYRYDAIDPQTQRDWPALPKAFADLTGRAARAAGFDLFVPDACLIDRYAPGPPCHSIRIATSGASRSRSCRPGRRARDFSVERTHPLGTSARTVPGARRRHCVGRASTLEFPRRRLVADP
jgi:hypothetical protein